MKSTSSGQTLSGMRLDVVFRVCYWSGLVLLFCIVVTCDDKAEGNINGSAANSSSPSLDPPVPKTDNVTISNTEDNINVTDLLRNVSSTGLDSLNAVLLLAKDYSTKNLSVLETTLKQLNKSSVVFLEIVIKGPEYITNTGPSYILKDNSSLALGYGSTYGETKAIVFGPTIGPTYGNSYGYTYGDTFGTTFGVTFGPTYGTTFGTTFGPTIGPSIGMTVGPTIGPSFGATYGATYGPSYGATYGNTIGPGYGAVYNLPAPLPPGGVHIASQETSKVSKDSNSGTPTVSTGKITQIHPQLRDLARDLGF